jgi:O-antigen/teichoic acid export membrane protein
MSGAETGKQPLAGRPFSTAIVRRTTVLVASQVGSRAVGLLFTLSLAHLLSVENFGILNIASSALVLGGMLQDLGLSRTVVKEVARRPDQAAFWVGQLCIVKALLGIGFGILIPLGAGAAGYPAEAISVLWVMGLALPFGNVWLLFENAVQGMNATSVLAVGYVASAAFQCALGLSAAVLTKGNLQWVSMAMVAASMLNLALIWRMFSAIAGRVRLGFDFAFVRRVVANSIPYLGFAVAVASMGRLEMLFLGRFAAPDAVAHFAAAYKIFESAIFAVYSFQIALNPVLAPLLPSRLPEFGRWFAWETSLAAALLVPALLAGIWLARPVLGLLFPPSYAAAAKPLIVLAVTLPVAALQVLGSGVLMLTDHQRTVLKITAVVLIVQVFFGLVLIPFYGATGAALAIAGTQTFAAALSIGLVIHWFIGRRAVLWPLAWVLGVNALCLLLALPVWRTCGAGWGTAVAVLTLTAGLAGRLKLSPPS